MSYNFYWIILKIPFFYIILSINYTYENKILEFIISISYVIITFVSQKNIRYKKFNKFCLYG